MSQQVVDPRTTPPTSANGPMRPAPGPHLVRLLSSLAALGTTSRLQAFDEPIRLSTTTSQASRASSAIPLRTPEDARAAISELRRLSGLTWERLSRVFGATRRSLHFWASGRTISRSNEERLFRLLALLRQADRGSAGENRSMLLQDHSGVLPIDLLAEGRHDEFIRLVGEGPGRRQLAMQPLSREARDARKPLPPEQLVDALQDSVHIEPGRGRAARTVKHKRPGRDG